MTQSATLGVLLDHTQDKIVLLDETGCFTYANGAVRRILGWDPEELMGEDAFQYIHPDDRPAAREMFERTIERDSYPPQRESPVVHGGRESRPLG